MLRVFGAVLILLGLPQAALACSCAFEDDVAVAFKEAAAVFTGTVTAIDHQISASEVSWKLNVTFSNIQSYKGDISETVTVVTNSQSAACGYSFIKDRSYLVFAREVEGGLSVSLCSKTQELKDAAADIEKLEKKGLVGEREG